MVRRKKLIIGIISIIIIIGIFLIGKFVLGKNYIEGTVSGRLRGNDSNPNWETFFVRVDQTGTMVFDLKWISVDENSKDAYVNMYVYNMEGEQLEVYSSPTSQFAFINITDLGPKNYLDFKVQIEAFSGEVDYTLRIIKPGELVEGNNSVIRNSGFFNIKMDANGFIVTDGDWIRVKNLTEKMVNVKVKIYNKSNGVLEFVKEYTEGIDLKDIEKVLKANNSYTMILTKLGSQSQQPFITDGLTPVDFQSNFINRMISGEQVDKYRLELNGERFIWLIWEKVVESQAENPILEMKLLDKNGNLKMEADRVDANMSAVLKIGDLQGTYYLEISSLYPARYAVGIENQNYGEYTFRPFKNYVLKGHLANNKKVLYNVSYNDTNEKLLDLVIKNISREEKAKVVVKFNGKTSSVELDPGGQDVVKFSIIPIIGQVYSLYLESSGGEVDFTLDTDYMNIEPKIVQKSLLFDCTKLTYFSANTEVNWNKVDFVGKVDEKYYYDLETIPLKVKEFLTDDDGTPIGKPDIIELKKWELVKDENDSTVQFINDTDKNCQILRNTEYRTDEVLLFKDSKGQYRLMVKWLLERSAGAKKVGKLKGYLNPHDTTPYIESDIIIHPTDLSKYNDDWISYAYEYIKEYKRGFDWKDVVEWAQDGSLHVTPRHSEVSVPLQMVGGVVLIESEKESYNKRYEPFEDTTYFHCETGIPGTLLKEAKKHYKNYIITYSEKDGKPTPTVFEYFWKHVGKTIDASWGKIPLNIGCEKRLYRNDKWKKEQREKYFEILNDKSLSKFDRIKNSRKYLMIYLDYGPDKAKTWESNGMKDEDDPTKFAYVLKHIREYPVEKWPDDLKNTYNELSKESSDKAQKFARIYIDYGKDKAIVWYNWYINNKDATDEMNFEKLCDPTITDGELQNLWDNIHVGEYQLANGKKVTLNPDTKEGKYSPTEWVDKGFGTLKEYFDAIVTKMVDENSYSSEIGKEILKYLIKYDYEQTKIYFEKKLEANKNSYLYYGYHPEYLFKPKYTETIIKPFIAQLDLSASYGLGQIMFWVAYSIGYRGELDGLFDDDTNIKYSIKHMAASKFKETVRGFSDTLVKPVEWYKTWNSILRRYNGGLSKYAEKVRNGEKQYIK